MKHFSVRQFEEGDVDFAYKMDMMEQWDDTKNDIYRMFHYEPKGCFVAEAEGKLVGHVFSISYGRLGWIGLLIVKAEYRRKGVGTLLIKKAMDYLLSGGVETIRLEAVSAIASLYGELGFVGEYDSLRFLATDPKLALASSPNVKILKKEKIKEIAKFDAEYFGANRTKVLNKLYQDNPELCFVSYAESKITGYLMCRKTETGYRIGPWACKPENPQAARELLMRCVKEIGCNVKLYVGVPAVNKLAVEILEEANFRQYSKSIRMRFGKKLETEHVSGIFAIGGPEKG